MIKLNELMRIKNNS